ncbi:MAG: hypothetical protein Cons2KO_18000 [Congregibacter sp.]
MEFSIYRLGAADTQLVPVVLDCFAAAFDDPKNYDSRRPDAEYLRRLLGDGSFIGLVALDGEQLLGALVAYELKKLEQQRSEIYIYDLAVHSAFRQRGVATALINALQPIAADIGACSIYVQTESDDVEAVSLYSKLGVRAEVLHFEFAMRSTNDKV